MMNTEELLLKSEINRLNSLSVNRDSKPMFDRTGIIRKINNIKPIDIVPHTTKNKKLKNSSSLPDIRADSRISESNMINIFENSNFDIPNLLEHRVNILAEERSSSSHHRVKSSSSVQSLVPASSKNLARND